MKYRLLFALLALAPMTFSQTGMESSAPVRLNEPLTGVCGTMGITSVSSTFAMCPDTISIRGHGLMRATAVLIGDEYIPMLAKTETEIRVEIPGFGKPGFWPVRVFAGSDYVEGMAEFWPTIQMRRSRGDVREMAYGMRDGVLRFKLNNGTPGTFLIMGSLRQRDEPRYLPDFGYLLFLREPLFVVSGGTIPDSGVLVRQFPYPPDLAGEHVMFQGWSSQRIGNGDLYCFTNMTEVDL